MASRLPLTRLRPTVIAACLVTSAAWAQTATNAAPPAAPAASAASAASTASAPSAPQAAAPAAVARPEVHLSPIVVTASGVEQKIIDAPASITVVTREELAKKPYVTLLDALREMEGVDVGETTDKGGQGTISIRGMGADYTLVLIDGRRQNNVGDIYPNNFGGGQFTHLPPLDAIERIEVIRGPMSTLYGSDAMGGVVNIITRKVAKSWGGSITQSATFQGDPAFGNQTTTDFYLSGPLVENTLGLQLRGSIYDRKASSPEYESLPLPDGSIWTPSLGFGGGGKTVANNNWSAGARLAFTPNSQHDLLLDFDVSRQKYDNTTSQVGTLDSLESIFRASNGGIVQPRVGYTPQQRFNRDQLSLTHNGRWDLGRSEIILSHVSSENLGRSLPLTVAERTQLQALWDAACVAAGNAAGCRGTNNASTGYVAPTMANLSTAQRAELNRFLPRQLRKLESRQTTLDAKFNTTWSTHTSVFGLQVIDAEMEDGVFGMHGAGYREGTVQPHRQWALFAEDNWTLVDSFTATTGIRYDKHSTFGSQVSPRLYGVWTANSAWTFKGGVSTGYKTPKASDLFPGITGFGGQGVNPIVGSPDLKPETSVTTELAAYFMSPQGHEFNATVFRNRFKDKIATGDSYRLCSSTVTVNCVDLGPGWSDFHTGTVSQKRNIDRAEVFGVELAGRYEFNKSLSLRANYTYTHSEQKSGPNAGRPITDNPAKHALNTTLNWRANDRFTTHATVEARSKRYRSFDTVTQQELYYEDYQILNVGATYKANDSVTFNALINNVLNTDFTSRQCTLNATSDGYNCSDDYLVKSPRRSFWVGMNVRF